MKKTVMITGASGGIGSAIAEAFAKDGWQLVLCCHDRVDKLNALQASLKTVYNASSLLLSGDAGDYATVSGWFEQIRTVFGHVDVLVNNAGISYIGLLTDMTPEDWQKIVSTNLTSVFNLSHLAIPDMVHAKSGKIINISSVWGCCGASCEVAYSATKGGINAFTQALAKELAPSNIQVNAVACGAIDTSMNQFLDPESRKALEDEIPAGRFGSPLEVGEFVLQLAKSPSYLTGQIIRLDGGWI